MLDSYDVEISYGCVSHKFSSLTNKTFDIPKPLIICCLRAIQKKNLYLHTGFGYPIVSYSRTMLHIIQGPWQGNRIAPAVWLLIIPILVIYLKARLCGVEIKTSFTGDVFKLVFIMFVGGWNF